jgi:molybdate transport system ATP-binding protein
VRADLELEAGDSRVLVLFGPSGSGKTTILRCLAGLDRPQEGFIRFGAEIWLDAATGVNRSPQARRLAYVAQDYGLFPHLTVEENVRFGMDAKRSAATPRVESILERVHLGGMAGRLPAQLSGGERQRVALARALARDPALVLLDEPLTALDLPLRDPMRQELRQFLRSLDVPSVVVTHDRVDALTLGDRMAVLSGGFIRQVGSVPRCSAVLPTSPSRRRSGSRMSSPERLSKRPTAWQPCVWAMGPSGRQRTSRPGPSLSASAPRTSSWNGRSMAT